MENNNKYQYTNFLIFSKEISSFVVMSLMETNGNKFKPQRIQCEVVERKKFYVYLLISLNVNVYHDTTNTPIVCKM